MTYFERQKSSILAFTFIFALSGCAGVPYDPIQVHIDAPDDYISGGVFKLQAVYETNGELTYVDVDDRLLYSDASFIVQLPSREQGILKEIRVELRHPKYRAAFEVIAVGAGLTPQAITVRPTRWTTNEKNTWIKPTYETLVAGMEHLRWISTAYFQRPERLAVNEAFQKDHRLVAQLAYGGGGKMGEWEELRQLTIAEWEAIAKVMEERSYEPCPPGYVLETLVNRPCGALVFEDTYVPPISAEERAAREEAEFRHIQLAVADLAKRKQIDVKTIRFAGYQQTMWETSAIGCPEEGNTYKREETPGYFLLLQPPYETYFYHGKSNEDPFYCDEEQRTY